MAEDRVVIAEILRSRGNKGEVLARSLTDIPGRLEDLKVAQVRLSDGSEITVEIESAWPFKGDWVFKFVHVDSITEADRFAKSDIWVLPTERGVLPEGEFFQSDLIGCQMVDQETGRAIGPVTGYQHFGASPLLEVKYQDRIVLIPFVPAICPGVDLPSKTIRAELPEGLLDL